MGSSVRSDTSTEVSPLQRAAVSKLMDSYRGQMFLCRINGSQKSLALTTHRVSLTHVTLHGTPPQDR
jgi:hypothetical protein